MLQESKMLQARVAQYNDLVQYGTLDNGRPFLLVSWGRVAKFRNEVVFTGHAVCTSQIQQRPGPGDTIAYQADQNGSVVHWCTLEEMQNAPELKL